MKKFFAILISLFVGLNVFAVDLSYVVQKARELDYFAFDTKFTDATVMTTFVIDEEWDDRRAGYTHVDSHYVKSRTASKISIHLPPAVLVMSEDFFDEHYLPTLLHEMSHAYVTMTYGIDTEAHGAAFNLVNDMAFYKIYDYVSEASYYRSHSDRTLESFTFTRQRAGVKKMKKMETTKRMYDVGPSRSNARNGIFKD